MKTFRPGGVILGELRELRSIEDAVSLIDEWIKAYRALAEENAALREELLYARMDFQIADAQLLLTQCTARAPEPEQVEEYNPFP